MNGQVIVACMLLAIAGFGQQATQPQSATEPETHAHTQSGTHAAPAATKGCLVVKSIGSHAVRNVLLFGVAGAIVSKQQYAVVDAVDYPARVGEKFHGNDLQTIANSTKVVVLDKHYTPEDLHKACGPNESMR